MNVSEMDTLRTATSAEYGKFDDLMRACFHHEMFGSDFKQDKRQFMVYCPKMAFCASGTPSQFYMLCPSVENGAYSRYLIYLAEQETLINRVETSDMETLEKYLGITLFPQAGVALGMALKASAMGDDGTIVRNITLFAVLIYELIGPLFTKIALTKAGEITPSGAVSARKNISQ